MSPVGHSLVGLALGCGVARPRERWALLPLYVLLANLPDWPLPGWGHDAYHVSHSLPVNLGLVAGAWLLLRTRVPRTVLVAGSAAWLSHLLLDSFYNHGRGVLIDWPVSDYRLTVPIPWLQTLDLSQPIGSQHNLSVTLVEAVTFGPVCSIGWLAARDHTDD